MHRHVGPFSLLSVPNRLSIPCSVNRSRLVCQFRERPFPSRCLLVPTYYDTIPDSSFLLHRVVVVLGLVLIPFKIAHDQKKKAKQPGRIVVPHAINRRSVGAHVARGYRPSPRLRRLTQGARVFPSRFPGASRFPCRFAFPGDSSVVALRFSRRFFCPGGSRLLAIPAWRFPTCPGGPWFGRTSTQSRFLVAFGAPAPSSKKKSPKVTSHSGHRGPLSQAHDGFWRQGVIGAFGDSSTGLLKLTC